jgi:hypothetical protein
MPREAERRFVEQEQSRPGDEGAGQRQHLLFAPESVPACCFIRSAIRGKYSSARSTSRFHSLPVASVTPPRSTFSCTESSA